MDYQRAVERGENLDDEIKRQDEVIAAKKAARQPIVNTPVADPKSYLSAKAVPSSNCFVADEKDKKYVCPECKAVEGGSARIITHNFNCKNKGKEYCQKGSKRSRTKKSKRSKSRSKKARKTRRSV
jgi:hypothetical protein